MKLKTKITVLALGAAMVVGMFSGCGTKETSSENITVTIWSGASHSKDVYTKYINDWNNTIGKEKGIYIDYQLKEGGTIGKAVELALQGGSNAPDFFTGVAVAKGAENNWILAIDDLPGGKEFLKPYEEQGLLNEWMQHGGKTYKVPVSSTTMGLIYNKEMFKEAGLVDDKGEAKPPETFAELREYARILTKPNERKYGIILPLKWSGWYNSDIMSVNRASQGFEYYNPVSGKFEFDGLKPIFEMYLGLKEDGSVYPGASGIDNDPARALFAEGGIGMKFGFSFDVGVLNDQFAAKIDWGVAPYPVADKNVKYKQRIDVDTSYLMNSKSLETVGAEKMFEVLKLFVSDKTKIHMYKEGVQLPLDYEIIDNVNIDNPKKGWTDFAKLLTISEPRQLVSPQYDISGLKDAQTLFLEDVWTGNITIDQAIEILNKRYNDGMEKYKSNHFYETDKYLIPDWLETTKR